MAAPIRLGIMGTAGINRRLLAGARLSPEIDAVAVGSRDSKRGEAFAAEYGIPRVHGSYEALLADPDVDAVYICLPNSLHHPWTMAALAGGKHVLCEKPYSRRPAEVTDAFDAAEQRGLVLAEAFMWRHAPQTRLLLELLPTIGDLEHIRATFSFNLDEPANIRLAADLDGGSLMDVGCYCVSASRLLAGEEPESVYGSQSIGSSGVDVRFTGILRFASGVTAEFMAGFTMDHRGIEAIGTAGSIQVPDPWHSEVGYLVRNGEQIAHEPGNPYHLELDNLAAAIRGEAPPLLGRADALGQARTIDALYASAASDTMVRL
jgi:D-xylose 1-dehydrogenase (NADP+, D-xylono-1,5-lactone-forming)